MDAVGEFGLYPGAQRILLTREAANSRLHFGKLTLLAFERVDWGVDKLEGPRGTGDLPGPKLETPEGGQGLWPLHMAGSVKDLLLLLLKLLANFCLYQEKACLVQRENRTALPLLGENESRCC